MGTATPMQGTISPQVLQVVLPGRVGHADVGQHCSDVDQLGILGKELDSWKHVVEQRPNEVQREPTPQYDARLFEVVPQPKRDVDFAAEDLPDPRVVIDKLTEKTPVLDVQTYREGAYLEKTIEYVDVDDPNVVVGVLEYMVLVDRLPDYGHQTQVRPNVVLPDVERIHSVETVS